MTRAPGGVRERPSPAGPAAPPHPRIRARRAEVARSAGLRRLRRLNVLLAVVCAAVWVGVVLRSPLLDVDRVQVVGAARTAAADVRAASGVDPGEEMVAVDLGAAAEGVRALPWVDEARVQRTWPGTVRITVTERTAVAAAPGPGGWTLLDADGRALEVVPSAAGLPRVDVGAPPAPGERVGEGGRELLGALAGLPPALADLVGEAGEGPDGIELALADGFRVVLGDASELGDKASAALAVREQADRDRGCRIDVRVASAPVLTGSEDCA